MSVDKILEKRNKIYGDYEGGTIFRANVMEAINNRHESAVGYPLTIFQTVIFMDIIGKLSRLAVTPEHIDSWADMEGYSKLIKEQYERRKNAYKQQPARQKVPNETISGTRARDPILGALERNKSYTNSLSDSD